MIIETATPGDLTCLLGFREEAAAWLSELGSDQWSRPYPADRLLKTIESGTVFMVRDGDITAATITLTEEAEEGLWTADELATPSMFVNKLTVARTHSGRNLGGELLDWAGDRAHRLGAMWLRLDAWSTNGALQRYYLNQGFEHVRTVREGGAVNGGPRVSGWLAQRPTCPADLPFTDHALAPVRRSWAMCGPELADRRDSGASGTGQAPKRA
ncbi:GNAT family N-acetyltransferase [Streptomyces albipurpureus]|uniref:GNAT family N-acetyltransferase n=1 Tax=Streptomyces albipurpureus TaxID=2897419 RepID=A0ABT0USL0_9ACTN|nr:GNAT family N-acetyltransferase [Streptomyces sp. CWNU-1]MCM2391337.1 GNAT family N-acetyltransferase [Streptomyces sp. CWNU-1]